MMDTDERDVGFNHRSPPPVPSMDGGKGDGLEDHILQRILNVDCRFWQSWSRLQ